MYYDLEGYGDANSCPQCESEEVEFVGYDDCGHYIQKHCKCKECGADLWFQFYIDGCDVTDEEE